ncbi:MAG: hypothetical protein JWR26_1872 [Pedosphaera sp.]|nr:hypothetical protein [Pedosphaera sp.]
MGAEGNGSRCAKPKAARDTGHHGGLQQEAAEVLAHGHGPPSLGSPACGTGALQEGSIRFAKRRLGCRFRCCPTCEGRSFSRAYVTRGMRESVQVPPCGTILVPSLRDFGAVSLPMRLCARPLWPAVAQKSRVRDGRFAGEKGVSAKRGRHWGGKRPCFCTAWYRLGTAWNGLDRVFWAYICFSKVLAHGHHGDGRGKG